jgi:hypothetical protein
MHFALSDGIAQLEQEAEADRILLGFLVFWIMSVGVFFGNSN